MPTKTGHISQVIGPVVDVHFDIETGESAELQLPCIHDALRVPVDRRMYPTL